MILPTKTNVWEMAVCLVWLLVFNVGEIEAEWWRTHACPT